MEAKVASLAITDSANIPILAVIISIQLLRHGMGKHVVFQQGAEELDAVLKINRMDTIAIQQPAMVEEHVIMSAVVQEAGRIITLMYPAIPLIKSPVQTIKPIITVRSL